MTATTLYGIANCDTIRKARRWLEARGIDHAFHDYRKQGLDASLLATLEAQLGWQAMLNRNGRSWRQLPEAVRDGIDRDSALGLMLDNPAIIKRPILAGKGRLITGFDPDRYEEILANP